MSISVCLNRPLVFVVYEIGNAVAHYMDFFACLRMGIAAFLIFGEAIAFAG